MRKFLVTTTLMLSLAATIAHADSIGIAECDDYVTKTGACLEKVPAAMKPGLQSSLDSMKTSWTNAANNPAAKPGIVSSCNASAQSMKASFKQYGCEY